jgi:hypothetical protein
MKAKEVDNRLFKSNSTNITAEIFRIHKARELEISEEDYLIFDEVHNIYPESTYVSIMNKFIFNHKLMQSPAKNPV